MTRLKPGGVEVVPSLLAADLGRLGEVLGQAARAGTRWVSVDVMDGHFVPNLSFGPDFVRLIKRLHPELCVDAHLMVANPEEVARFFVQAGADFVTFHVEACREPGRLLRELRRRGVGAGLAIRPATPPAGFLRELAGADLALVMTVEPGFGGARFIREMLPRVRETREALRRARRPCWLQVDGGINAETIAEAAAAGADSLVAGTAVFGAPDIARAVRELRSAAERAFRGGAPSSPPLHRR